MIKYALKCDHGHGFEAWFSSSSDYDSQVNRGLVECPICGSPKVSKQIMAPSVRTSRQKYTAAPTTEIASAPNAGAPGAPTKAALAKSLADALPQDTKAQLAEIAGKVRAHVKKNFTYVGSDFAKEARAMHEGERAEKPIYGETTTEEAKALKEDGVPSHPLPDAFAPVPDKKLN